MLLHFSSMNTSNSKFRSGHSYLKNGELNTILVYSNCWLVALCYISIV